MPVVAGNEHLVQLTCQALSRIATSAEASVHVLLNGIRGMSVEAFHAELRRHCRFPVETVPGERSVAASWNEGCRQALLDGADYLLLLANDAVLEPTTLDCLLEFGADPANAGCMAWSAAR